MKPLSCPKQFPGKRFHKCSTLALVRLFVAAAATVYQEPHFWRTEGQERISVWPKIFNI